MINLAVQMEDDNSSQAVQENKIITSYGSFQLKPKETKKNPQTNIDSLGNLSNMSNMSAMSGNLSQSNSRGSFKKEAEPV